MTFASEADFEEALIQVLTNKGWEKTVIKHPTEADLLKNWANILFENNNTIDRLNNCPLTDSEMQQIIEKIIVARTPLKLNGFINGKTVSIKRDNPDDKLHYGLEISLKIYDRNEIAAGQSRYQIVQQPHFSVQSPLLNKRRGDLMLLINGMPVIHIELKRSHIPVSEATNQIRKYMREGVFSGLFSLVQIFVAMNPENTVYFANPGPEPEGKFNSDYFFHWADFTNEPINDWKGIASSLLSIPMAHQLIGFYTVADNSDGVLKVMRSYQYYAANAISDTVSKIKWDSGNQRGGYIWHTTGSGKTMTSFKSAQLIASSNDADKVIFLMDRIELGTQSLKEYRAFANDNETVQATENTDVLINRLKSDSSLDTLIVTSIQKMSNIKAGEENLNDADLAKINRKRIVFIIDEAHRSTFGEMLATIKNSFPNAVFFGFTGTPIHEENQKKLNTTSDIFGDELHRYVIADGIRDKNVLGFDPYKVLTFKDKDIRHVVGLEQAKATSLEEVSADPEKEKIYYRFMQLPMYGHRDEKGKWVKGIEDYIPTSQYHTPEHQKAVVHDIMDNWLQLSRNNFFHAIFATSSIPEAIHYYRLLKEFMPELKITCLFDPNIDNNGDIRDTAFKEDGLVEIIQDYNERYNQKFSLPTFAAFKKDVSFRLAHKEQYKYIENEPQKQLNLLIVVDQMLTGFDSKWLNTLYLDKVLYYEGLIQAFSRTNRLFGEKKPFGIIRYYRKPHSMEQNVQSAFKLYSGDKPIGLFAVKLHKNLRKINEIFADIVDLFQNDAITDFSRLPEENAAKGRFASLFNKLDDYYEAAVIQGFKWDKSEYQFEDEQTNKKYVIKVDLDEATYSKLLQRYKELENDGGIGGDDIPFDLKAHLTEIDTGLIDTAYMNSRFEKYIKALDAGIPPEELEAVKNDLHKSFALLSQEEQKYANIFLHDIQSGNIKLEIGKTFRDYVTEYQSQAKNDKIHRFASLLGLDEEQLRNMVALNLNEKNINEFGRLDDLKKTIDMAKAKLFMEALAKKPLIPPLVHRETDKILRKFILSGGADVDLPTE